METEIDLTLECCMTCKYWQQFKGFDVPWGDCEEIGEETNMHSECEDYEAM